MKKRLLGIIMCAVMAAGALTGCGAASSSGTTTTTTTTDSSSTSDTPADAIVIQMGHANPGKEDDPYNKYCTLFGEHLTELSGGKYAIDVIADGQLGGERDVFEGMQMGTVDAALVTTMIVANFVPQYRLLDLPYLFYDYDDAHTVLDSEEIMGGMEQQVYDNCNVKILGYGENGFRKVLNSVRPINSLADMKGMKIRTPESTTYLDAFTAMGANPTSMSFSELFTGLQQKTIDGLELPIASIYTKKFYEVADYLSGTDAMFTAYAVCFSRSFWDNLSEEEQGWFEEAAKLATEEERVHLQSVEQNFLDEMIAAGLNYNEVENIDELREACEVQYTKYTDDIGEDLLNLTLEKLGRN